MEKAEGTLYVLTTGLIRCKKNTVGTKVVEQINTAKN